MNRYLVKYTMELQCEVKIEAEDEEDAETALEEMTTADLCEYCVEPAEPDVWAVDVVKLDIPF